MYVCVCVCVFIDTQLDKWMAKQIKLGFLMSYQLDCTLSVKKVTPRGGLLLTNHCVVSRAETTAVKSSLLNHASTGLQQVDQLGS